MCDGRDVRTHEDRPRETAKLAKAKTQSRTHNSRVKIWGNCIARSLLAEPDGSVQTPNCFDVGARCAPRAMPHDDRHYTCRLASRFYSGFPLSECCASWCEAPDDCGDQGFERMHARPRCAGILHSREASSAPRGCIRCAFGARRRWATSENSTLGPDALLRYRVSSNQEHAMSETKEGKPTTPADIEHPQPTSTATMRKASCRNATTRGAISRRRTVPARNPARASRQSVELLSTNPKRLCCVFAAKPHKFSPSNAFQNANIFSDLLPIIFFL